MKLSLAELFNVKVILTRNLLGVDITTGERSPVKLLLPVSMKRHLRRLLEEIEGEIKIAEPDRTEFIAKWKKYGEKKDALPTVKDKCFEEFKKEYSALFDDRDFAIPFAPFKLELLDNLNEIIPDDIEGLMVEMNRSFSEQQKEVAADTSAGETNKGVKAPIPDA